MEKTKYLAIALVVMVIINLVLIVVYVSPGGNESKQKGRRAV